MIHVLRVYHAGMAKSVQIRDVPDQVHRALRTRAAEAGKSLSDYLLEELLELSALPSIAASIKSARSQEGGATTEQIVAAARSGRDT